MPLSGEASETVGGVVSLGAAPVWLTVKVWPAIVNVPVNELVVLFAATE